MKKIVAGVTKDIYPHAFLTPLLFFIIFSSIPAHASELEKIPSYSIKEAKGVFGLNNRKETVATLRKIDFFVADIKKQNRVSKEISISRKISAKPAAEQNVQPKGMYPAYVSRLGLKTDSLLQGTSNAAGVFSSIRDNISDFTTRLWPKEQNEQLSNGEESATPKSAATASNKNNNSEDKKVAQKAVIPFFDSPSRQEVQMMIANAVSSIKIPAPVSQVIYRSSSSNISGIADSLTRSVEALRTEISSGALNVLSGTASSTSLFGAHLTTCDPVTGKLVWSDGQFGCGTDYDSGGSSNTWATSSTDYFLSLFRDFSVQGNGYLAPTSTRGIIVSASSTISSLTVSSGTTTNATSTNFAITGITSALLKTNSNGSVVPAVAGTDYITAASVWATTSQDYYNSQFRDWSVLNSTTIAPTSTKGILVSASSTINSNLVITGNSTTTNATTTALAISSIASSLLKTNANGSVLAAVPGTDYLNASFRDWSIQGNGYLAPTSTRGILLTSSSTILGGLTIDRATTTSATTTNLAISGVTSALLKTNANGSVAAAVAGTDYLNASFRDWSVQGNGYLAPTTTRGILVAASSTIGAGTQAGGLTIFGSATTTGIAFFSSSVAIGSSSPWGLFSVNGNGLLAGAPQLAVGSSTKTDFIVTNAGFIGVGSTTPWAQFSINPSNLIAGAPQFVVGSSTATNLIVTNAGRVGIGTTTPGAALNVIGALCVDDASPTCANSARTAGTIYSVAALSASLDLAENYPTKDSTLVAGEIVKLDKDNPVFVSRASDEETAPIIGIVSTKPGFWLGGFNDEVFPDEIKLPIALSGRVPVKVNDEGGPITVGDHIALSSVPGVGMKQKTSGETVGIALENMYGEEGVIEVFVTLKQRTLSNQLSVNDAGDVGVGTSTPSYKLHVMGDIAAQSFINISTRDEKKDISYINSQNRASILDTIRTLGIARYHYNNEDSLAPLHLGLIAEESPADILAPEGKGVDVYKLSTYILAGIQEQQTQIDDLRLRIANLESKPVSITASESVNIEERTENWLSSLGVAIRNGIAQFVAIIAQKISADEIIVGSPNNAAAAGLTTYDHATGQPVCIFVDNGIVKASQGACGSVQTTSPENPQPQVNTSASNPEEEIPKPSEATSTPDVTLPPEPTQAPVAPAAEVPEVEVSQETISPDTVPVENNESSQ